MSFLLMIFLIILIIYGYSGWRLIGVAPWEPYWKLLSGLVILALGSLPLLLSRIRDANAPSKYQDLLAWLTYLGMGFFTVNTSLLVVRDLGWLLLSGIFLFNQSPPLILPSLAQAHTANMATFGLAIVLTLYGFYRARYHIRVRRVAIPIADLPADLNGFTIAQISDLHVGPTIKRPFIEKVVQQVNALQADLIALTGDLADGPVEYLRPHTAPLAELRAPHGTFFVTGNHEYYSGVEAWLAEASRLGFTLLLNQHHLLHVGTARLALVGVTDFSASDSAPDSALRATPDGTVRVLLAHQPRSITSATQAGCALQLSGHTHGGQFIPWKYLIPLQQPYVTGLHRVDHTWLFVSNGTGYWGPPLRLGAPAEIVLITLKRTT
jgi:predicted MPP superfamily phosphohydrolase